MSHGDALEGRGIWPQSTTTSNTALPAFCTPLILPSGGVIVFNSSYTTTLTSDVQFKQLCEQNATVFNPGSTGNSTIIGLRDPFYASDSPQVFAIATATVISYLLVILIFITPRTFVVGGPGGGVGFPGRRGVITGSYGGSSVVGVGRRPWLQKIATITVAISLTIATADTFKVAERQYQKGYMDSGTLVDDVVGSLEIRIVRIISDTFLWLAQVQTLIRLFPRHKEKVTIKWLGFVLVSFDTIFSVLNDFVDPSTRTRNRSRSFQDAIPALSYLFELAISLIYASCVIYYSLSKRRFAFWHPKMRNICLVALLSLMSVLVPVVFFVLDVSKPSLAGWGDYIRWVGAAAASVVVWEWVERIETLERDERKDGILGREIFDGDEMLDDGDSDDVDWPGQRAYRHEPGLVQAQPGHGQPNRTPTRTGALRSRIPFYTRKHKTAGPTFSAAQDTGTSNAVHGPIVPPQAVTPVSRSDTTSASTIYAIHYHTIGSPSPAIVEEPEPSPQPGNVSNPNTATEPHTEDSGRLSREVEPNVQLTGSRKSEPRKDYYNQAPAIWKAVANPFKRRRASPPAEVAVALFDPASARRPPVNIDFGLRNRLGGLRSSRRTSGGSTPMAVTVIPAPRRDHRAWSPADQDDQVRIDSMDPALANPSPVVDTCIEEPEISSSKRQGSDIPMTVVPAPRRGQRTWSPDDLRIRDQQASPYSSPSPVDSNRSGIFHEVARLSPPAARPQGPIFGSVMTTRGTLTISEGPRANVAARTSPGAVPQPSSGSAGDTSKVMESSSVAAVSVPSTMQQAREVFDVEDAAGPSSSRPQTAQRPDVQRDIETATRESDRRDTDGTPPRSQTTGTA